MALLMTVGDKMNIKPLPDIDCYELVEPLRFWVDYIECEIPAGFVSDGASVPKIFWSIITSPFHPKVIKRAFQHDYLYRVHIVPKKKADKKFKKGLIYDGFAEVTAETMYSALKLFGDFAYKEGPKKPIIGVYYVR